MKYEFKTDHPSIYWDIKSPGGDGRLECGRGGWVLTTAYNRHVASKNASWWTALKEAVRMLQQI